MKGGKFIWLLFTALVLTACKRDYIPHKTEQALSITIEFPAVPDEVSKADVGEVPATSLENAIYDLSIWVFEHEKTNDVHMPVAHFSTNEASELPSAGGVRKYSLEVEREVALRKPNVDVFVLVNKASINSILNDDSSWEDLNNAVFGGSNYFSPSKPVTSESIVKAVADKTYKGLPMSGVGKDLKIEGEEPYFSIPTVSVGRAVSKLRFFFCQMKTENNTDEVFKIDKIELDGDQIASEEYVFSEDAYHIVPNKYVKDAIVTDCSKKELKSNDTPELYSYAGQDGPSYQRLVDEAIKADKISDMGTYYLRESDKALTGTVYYSITKSGITSYKEMSFSMAHSGDFARNHTWTVYGYFISNRTLQLAVNVLPWDKNNYTIKFNDESLQVLQKFTVDRTTADVVRIGESNEYNVFLKSANACRGYLYVVTPQGGKLEIIPKGSANSLEAFSVTPGQATIDPSTNGGRIDIFIDRNRDPNYTKDPTGCTITLEFSAYTPDGDREIYGSTECIDQIYHFYL